MFNNTNWNIQTSWNKLESWLTWLGASEYTVFCYERQIDNPELYESDTESESDEE